MVTQRTRCSRVYRVAPHGGSNPPTIIAMDSRQGRRDLRRTGLYDAENRTTKYNRKSQETSESQRLVGGTAKTISTEVAGTDVQKTKPRQPRTSALLMYGDLVQWQNPSLLNLSRKFNSSSPRHIIKGVFKTDTFLLMWLIKKSLRFLLTFRFGQIKLRNIVGAHSNYLHNI